MKLPLILTLVALCGAAIGNRLAAAQPQESKNPPPLAIGALSGAQGWDSAAYIRVLVDRIEPRWVKATEKRLPGQVVISMDLNRACVPQNVQVAKTSRDEMLDLAAISAINAARPFPALPPQFTDIRFRLELTFSHNVLFGLDTIRFAPAPLPRR